MIDLDQKMTHEAYDHMLARAVELVEGLSTLITRRALPWHISNVGARVELICAPAPPKNGSEARAAMDHELKSLLHLMLTNRGSVSQYDAD